MWRFIFSGWLIFVGVCGHSQEIPEDFLLGTGPKFAIRSIQFNYNVLRMTENILGKPKSSQELQAELGIHKYFLVLDLGTASTLRGKDYTYENEGSFWRTGIDVNMAEGWREGTMIGLGLRYAKAKFEDNVNYSKILVSGETEILTQDISIINKDLSARWAELVFKMRVNIWKDLYTGYTMRYQFFNVIEGMESELQPYDIPGFGKTNRPNSFGFDYYFGWRLNFK